MLVYILYIYYNYCICILYNYIVIYSMYIYMHINGNITLEIFRDYIYDITSDICIILAD